MEVRWCTGGGVHKTTNDKQEITDYMEKFQVIEQREQRTTGKTATNIDTTTDHEDKNTQERQI